jgi:hypothetical protein
MPNEAVLKRFQGILYTAWADIVIPSLFYINMRYQSQPLCFMGFEELGTMSQWKALVLCSDTLAISTKRQVGKELQLSMLSLIS